MKQCTIDDDDELKLQKSPSCVVFKSKFNLFTILLLAQEQEQVLDSEPPPLLKEVRDGKNLRTIPCLDSLPVLSTYNCIESYFHVYQPLMLFELWTSISKDVDEGSRNEDSHVFFYTIKHETPRILFTTLNCAVIILEGSERPRKYDLCKFSWADRRTDKKGYAFGIITSVMNNWSRMDSSHIRVSQNVRKSRSGFYGEMNVMVTSTRPPDRESLIELVKLSSIQSFVQQLKVHSLLAESPIARFVFDPRQPCFNLELLRTTIYPSSIRRRTQPSPLRLE